MRMKCFLFLFIVVSTSFATSQNFECGTHKAVRPIIIGGNSTVRGEQPWKAALIRDDGQFFCGGSLVSNKAVVTAAHCIIGKDRTHEFTSEEFSVILGAQDLLKSFERGRINAGVKTIHVHPDWNVDSDSYDGDIALLMLEDEVQFSNNIQPVCLSKPQSPAAQATEGIVIGYGKTESGKVSNIAKKIIAPIKVFHDCAKENQNLKQFLTARTFCGGPGDGKGICEGDSGSGLYVFYENRYYLRGTASASTLNSINDCDVNTFAIFVDATDYCGWIQSGGINKYAQCLENDQLDFTTTHRSVPTRRRRTKPSVQTTTTEPPTTTTTKEPIRDTLYAGEYLKANEILQSKNKCFKVYYQGDGNFVIYRSSSMQHTWHTSTHGTCPKYAYMQTDGNFVVYDCSNVAKWHSHTNGHSGARIVIQDDGNLVVYSPSNVALWNSGTETCGKQTPLSSISAGAKHTVRGEHPWKVALINEDGNFICGGTLISNKAIVTAAQCIQKKNSQQPLEPEDLSVVLAAQDLSKVLEKGRVVVGVKSIHIHPDFNTDIGSFEGDVALLTLDSEVQFNSYIQPVCLSKPLSSSVQVTEGIVVGHQKVEGKNVAKKFETSIKSYHKCSKEKSYLKPYLDARTVCGTYHDCTEKNWPTDVEIDIRFEFESSDIECGAAIGSGLYVLHNNRFYLRGITVASSYGIFVNTAEYCGWIQSGGLNKYAHCTENDFTTTTQRTTTKKLTTTQPAIIQPPPVVTTTTQKPTKTSLLPNECLYPNDFLQTTNKCFKLIYQGDGNLVIYRTSSNQHTWHTQTHGTCTKYACMQGDGNFVVYDCNNVAKWNSHTHGNPGARLELQIDGNLVVYSTGNVALWNSGTVTHC